jgi:hypothetical protein
MDPRANWARIRRFARSTDEFERSLTLGPATAIREFALSAAGFPRHTPRQGVLDRVVKHGLFSRKGWPTEQAFRKALDARNTAAHGGLHGKALPDRAALTGHVKTLHDSWRYLRRQFVTKRTAAALAQRILASGRISYIFLYGSLARAEREPGDIDLLLLDDGELSIGAQSIGAQYGMSASEYLLEALEVLDEVNRAAIHCGWLDVMAIDGVRFGHDPQYTRLIAKLQRDSLFFVNIAEDVMAFEAQAERWVGKRPAVFERLALLRGQLENEGVVGKQKKATLRRRESKVQMSHRRVVGDTK